jgi:cell wall-associated NlpC family hydrolase
MELKYENLLGKPWKINEVDCFSMVRDFFKQNFDIDIENIARPNNWDADVLDLITLSYPRSGFEIMHNWDDLRPADVLCTAFNSSNPNHFVIYVGDNKIIHHRFGMNSTEETYRPAWRAVTGYVLRHPDVPDLRPKLPDGNLEDLIRARFQLQV